MNQSQDSSHQTQIAPQDPPQHSPSGTWDQLFRVNTQITPVRCSYTTSCQLLNTQATLRWCREFPGNACGLGLAWLLSPTRPRQPHISPLMGSKQAPTGTRCTCFGKQIQKRDPHAPKSQRSLFSLQGPHQLRTTEVHLEEHTSASDAAGAGGIWFQNRPGPCQSLRRGSGRKGAKPCQTSVTDPCASASPRDKLSPLEHPLSLRSLERRSHNPSPWAPPSTLQGNLFSHGH